LSTSSGAVPIPLSDTFSTASRASIDKSAANLPPTGAYFQRSLSIFNRKEVECRKVILRPD